MWFGATQVGQETGPPPLGRLTPSAASPGTSNGIDLFPTPRLEAPEECCANFIRAVAFDGIRGRVWFTRSTGVFGYGVAASMAPGTEAGYNVGRQAAHLELGGVAVAADGTAWLTESGTTNATTDWPGNRVAWASGPGALNELPNLADQTPIRDGSRFDAKPTGITITNDGDVWFTEANPGNPGYRIAKALPAGTSGSYQEFQLPCVEGASPCSGSNTGTGPVSIAATPNGDLWYTNQLNNSVGHLDLENRRFTEYPLATIDGALAGGQPRAIRVAPDGTLWVAEFGFISRPGANAIVRIVPGDTPTADVYKTGAGKSPLGVAPDTKGNVWFVASADSGPSLIGRLAGVTGDDPGPDPTPTPTPGGGGTTPPPGPAPGGTVLTPGNTATATVGDPHVRGTTTSVDQICVGPPEDRCSLIYIISAHEYVTGFPGTRASVSGGKKRKTRLVVVGRKTVTLHGGQKKTVKIKLNKKGKKLLKRDGRLNATLKVSRKLDNGKKKKLKAKKLVFKKK